MCCGLTPPRAKMHVDHIKPRSKFPRLELDINNLQILCQYCNIGKSNLYEDDWRPWNWRELLRGFWKSIHV
ncbi:HNH endonuclease [Dyadobacter jiangsuensis]|uniref:HNH endonuclease n=1 Tax=Dyadobacter jiangsuensis TaxID=1591085 RepID=UPI000D0D79B8